MAMMLLFLFRVKGLCDTCNQVLSKFNEIFFIFNIKIVTQLFDGIINFI